MNLNDPKVRERLKMVRAAIKSKTLHKHQIAKLTGMSSKSAQIYACYLVAQKEAYVAAWPGYGTYDYPIPAYRLGTLPSVPKPQARTRRYWYLVMRSDSVLHELNLARRRAQRRKPKRMDIVAALFGSGPARRLDQDGR